MGSNQGDREANLRRGLDELRTHLTLRSVSSIYETEPVGVVDQPAFLNLAAGAETALEPAALLRLVKDIEREVGRRPSYRWGPRVLDIDILLYGDLTVDDAELVIPHREMTNRAFVLVPLAEIAPDVVHPRLGMTVRELAARVPGRDTVRPYQGPNRSSAQGSPSL
jgi:2-amino-4-hydroxy-6-hydroxymethyldihydropteridine diphosphokinase